MRLGLEGLKPKPRSDSGQTRVLTGEMAEKILAKVKAYPKTPATVIYEMLLKEQVFLKSKVSLATVRRFIRANASILAADAEPEKQMLRFAQENINDLWQTDVLHGPYVKDENKKKATYLLAYLDDKSRLITHGQFYLSQDFAALRHSFKEAVLRRGIPTLLYTDNAKIYRSQSFAYLCANIGVTLLHHGVRLAHQKGKIERFFRTVRSRFLSCITEKDLLSLENLNEKFWLWLDNDYHKRAHEGLQGQTPLDSFLSQAQGINLPTDLADFNTKFLVSVTRTVKKDATLSLNGHIYETDTVLAGAKLDVKYDPEASISEVFLYREDSSVGVGRLVNFQENARRKRIGQNKPKEEAPSSLPEMKSIIQAGMKSHTISYADLQRGEA